MQESTRSQPQERAASKASASCAGQHSLGCAVISRNREKSQGNGDTARRPAISRLVFKCEEHPQGCPKKTRSKALSSAPLPTLGNTSQARIMSTLEQDAPAQAQADETLSVSGEASAGATGG